MLPKSLKALKAPICGKKPKQAIFLKLLIGAKIPDFKKYRPWSDKPDSNPKTLGITRKRSTRTGRIEVQIKTDTKKSCISRTQMKKRQKVDQETKKE